MPLREEQRDWLALALVPGVGTTLFVKLLARFRSPGEVLRASEAALTDVVGPKLAQRIRNYRDVVDVDAQERLLDSYGATLYTMDDSAYPRLLAEIYDPPLVLFARGELREQHEYAVAIVGTRAPSPYGFRVARRLGYELASRGITVVSGLASGTDTAAHEGALEAGGQTIAVLGCGVDVVYPAENADLMHRIVQRGCVLSSFFMGVKPSKGHFPFRNRIVSGLSLGTIVVEAPPGSGALISARFAVEQGREVFAVPGHIGDRNAIGPHSLLREGAKLVETVEDVLVELDLPAALRQAPARSDAPTVAAALPVSSAPRATASVETDPARLPGSAAPAVAPSPRMPLSEVERDVLASLATEGSFVDEIALACRIPVSEALSTLTMLELKGLARQFSGKRFAPR